MWAEAERRLEYVNKVSDDNEVLSLAEFKSGLADPCYAIRLSMAYRKEFRLTDKEKEAGLIDEHEDVRIAFLLRTDIHLQQTQIHRALTDPYLDVFIAALCRSDLILLDCDINALIDRIKSMTDANYAAYLIDDLECRLQMQMAIDIAHKRKSMVSTSNDDFRPGFEYRL